MPLSLTRMRSSKTNMSLRMFSTRSGSPSSSASRMRLFRSAVGEVEYLGDRLDAAGLLVFLDDDGREAAFEALLDLLDDLGIGVLHRRDAAHDLELLGRRKAREHFGRLLGLEVRQHQRYGLRMLLLDEREEVGALRFLEERERRGADGLLDGLEYLVGFLRPTATSRGAASRSRGRPARGTACAFISW